MAEQKSFTNALVSGACAGLSIDVLLFPLDTLRTRLQSPQGFKAAGGFQGVFKGLSAAAIGAAPGSAMFFSTYETIKPLVRNNISENQNVCNVISAGIGDSCACLFRVPTENCKQRMQVGEFDSLKAALTGIIRDEGPGGLYRGLRVMIIREAPFAMIQFPIWEGLKRVVEQKSGTSSPLYGSLCGCVAGGLTGWLTTPLDTIKTRIVLGADSSGVQYSNSFFDTAKRIFQEGGVKSLWAGAMPRSSFLCGGGFIFLGTYDLVSDMLKDSL